MNVDSGDDRAYFYFALNLYGGQEAAMRSPGPSMNATTNILYLQKLLLTHPDSPTFLRDQTP